MPDLPGCVAAGATRDEVVRLIQEAIVFAYNLPPIIGLGTGSGFEFQLQDFSGAPPRELAAVARGLVFAANQNPQLGRVFTTFAANTPQLFLDIDRTIARMLNVPLANVFSSVQADLGGTYVNDFNTLGRIYQVRLQGDAAFRTSVQDISQIKVRSSTGEVDRLVQLAEHLLLMARSDRGRLPLQVERHDLAHRGRPSRL